ncbi:DUF1152 domain-containing protein [Nocardioides luteus]|uniref:DUF1152 domain-containing protein n=1 Tax=Nocardioides luteus TaxID=1844 RepID=UPI0018CADA60|nr:DUF1152 domain-containing protein [Nocardioides luteus]MBG6098325.1 hypothetical protein [Nocardioides luteus]
MRTLLVAAGGGGDAVGAMLIRRLLGYDARERALISTCAWERLRIDPVPGPRSRGDFVGLRAVAGVRAEIGPSSDTLPAGRSVLPRLAGDINARLFVHDFAGGAVGLAHQLRSLAQALDAQSLTVVDVGGDVIARGNEPRLLSPLADSLTLAASLQTDMPVRLAILGPGVDGELTAGEVTQSLERLNAERIGAVTPSDVGTLSEVLAWHPTEATTLAAAAALGHRGTVDMRRGLDPVPVTDDSASVWCVEAPAIEDFPLAAALIHTHSLQAAEEIMRNVAVDELDYERRRSTQRSLQRSEPLSSHLEASRRRGASMITTRRLLEASNAELPNFEQARLSGLGLWDLGELAAAFARVAE